MLQIGKCYIRLHQISSHFYSANIFSWPNIPYIINRRTYNTQLSQENKIYTEMLIPIVWVAKNWTNTVFVLPRASCVEFVWKMRIRATSVPRVYFQTTKETTNTASDNMADCAFHGITTPRRQIVWRYIRLPAIASPDPSFQRLYVNIIPLVLLFEKS